MVYLSEFNINAFRGIKDLKVSNLGDVNLILGDNNCGKTSFLESIMLMQNIFDFSNILKVSRTRNSNYFINNRLSPYDNFLYLFNPNEQHKVISVSGKLNNQSIDVSVEGEINRIMIDRSEYKRNDYQIKFMESESFDLEEEISEFSGIYKTLVDGDYSDEEFKINEYTPINGMRVNSFNTIKMKYISPMEHFSNMVFGRVVKEPSYKEIVINVIQLFDKNIIDLLYLKNDLNNRPVEYVTHKELGNVPLSTFGDGIKKVLLLANSIAQSAGGILLIDEIETSIHSKYFEDIFKFVIKACKAYDIQLFITSHSIETIDGFLNIQEYDSSDHEDPIRIITLKKFDNKTYSRVLNGKEAYIDRKQYGLEVRV